MDGRAMIAICLSVGISLLAGLFSVWVAMRSRNGAAVHPDKSVSILCGIAVLLIVLNLVAAARIAVGGMAYVGLLRIALLLTASFAVAGMVFGLVRALRSGRATASPAA